MWFFRNHLVEYSTVLVVCILSAVAVGWASMNPVPEPPPTGTIRASFCSNDFYRCKAQQCTTAVFGCVQFPNFWFCGGFGSGRFDALGSYLYVCRPSSNWKHTCTEFAVLCGYYQVFWGPNCAGRPASWAPGYQISCR